ncbi:unnamed protein product [Diatraea saccharalis]|uniref:Uncharacterized protein n=1 Tax=Diatraea saccharalis TaxID=40085 RepID=A0A9N9R9A0_9NEOP|nr:unnamed protein product [Diatraea saccharalis]
MLNSDIDDGWFLKSILWTDEFKFSKEGITNFHNLHEWVDKDNNPHWKKQDLPDDYIQLEDEPLEKTMTSSCRQDPQEILADHRNEVNVQRTNDTVNINQELDEDFTLASISQKTKITLIKDNINIDDHVLVRWGNRIYPGKVLSTCEEGLMVDIMKRGVKF